MSLKPSSVSHLDIADQMFPSKLITRTVIAGRGTPIAFFQSKQYVDFLLYCEKNHVDRSVSFHKDGTTMYIIEVVDDAKYIEHEKKWNEVVLAEMPRWSLNKILLTSGVQDALDFN